jgi:hypothetical protein
MTKIYSLALGLLFMVGACVHADNGQPKMQAALGALQSAQGELNSADADKGGYRQQALQLVAQAIGQVQAGIQYAQEHPHELGPDAGPAEAEPVDGEVAGAANQPHMGQAIVDLREARKQLKGAEHDKGGYRAQAMQSVNQAIEAVKQGIQFANQNHG